MQTYALVILNRRDKDVYLLWWWRWCAKTRWAQVVLMQKEWQINRQLRLNKHVCWHTLWLWLALMHYMCNVVSSNIFQIHRVRDANLKCYLPPSHIFSLSVYLFLFDFVILFISPTISHRCTRTTQTEATAYRERQR